MKKIKYLIGCFVVGLGLLNLSFGYDVQLVNSSLFLTGFNGFDFSKSYSYLYRTDWGQYNDGFNRIGGGYFGYKLYYNNQLITDYSYKESTSSSICNTSVLWNNSVYELDTYNSTCPNRGTNSSYYSRVNTTFSSSDWSTTTVTPVFLAGKNDNFGKGFLTIISNSTLNKYPRINFGNGFFSGNDYSEYSTSTWSKGLRLFYDTTGTLPNKLNDINFVYPVSTDPDIHAWELFGPSQVLTNFGYIVDSYGNRGKTFGSLGMGYSVASYKNTLTWDNLLFFTMYDEASSLLPGLGGFDFLNTDTSNQFHTFGIMVLKKDQYSSNGNEGVILLSKNPNNVKQVLYQEFDCQTNNVNCLVYGGSWCQNYLRQDNTGFQCMVLGQGVLSYSGSTDVLPFSGKDSIPSYIGPFLNYVLDITDLGTLGYTHSDNTNLCFGNGNDICFQKVQTTDSIKQIYLNGGFSDTTGDTNYSELDNGIFEQCTTNAYFAVVNYDICKGLNPSGTITISGQQYIITDVQIPGTDEIIKKAVPLSQYNNGVYVDDYGISYNVCSSEHPCNISNEGSIYFSGGILDSAYYDFDNTGLFFKCPYPYDSLINIYDWNLNIGNFDILGPVNCFVSAFKHGRSFDMFDNVGLFDFGPLIQGNTHEHKILFSFFDVLLTLGFVLFFSLLYKRFK